MVWYTACSLRDASACEMDSLPAAFAGLGSARSPSQSACLPSSCLLFWLLFILQWKPKVKPYVKISAGGLWVRLVQWGTGAEGPEQRRKVV